MHPPRTSTALLVVDPDDLAPLLARCGEIVANKESGAFAADLRRGRAGGGCLRLDSAAAALSAMRPGAGCSMPACVAVESFVAGQ